MKKIASLSFAFGLLFLNTAQADEIEKSSQHDFKIVEVTDGIEDPWGFDFLPDGRILVTEQDNKVIRIVADGKLDPKPITGLPNNIQTGGQGGLLDIAVHPKFSENNLIYIAYSGSASGGAGTEVVRAELDGYGLKNVEKIFEVNLRMRGRHHFGTRLVFAADGTLFFSIGDRYSLLDEAQNPDNHMGSVIRINDDGTIPTDNPYVGQTNKRDEIYSIGHRNPQGMALRPSDKVMWMHEHGPKGGDEVNILDKPGANYGWPAITYGIDYSGAIISDKTEAPGMEQPVIHWTPSIAPSGMAFYEGDKFPNWVDDIFVGALRGSHIRRLELDGNEVIEQEVLLDGFARIRDVASGPDGYLYFITDESNGKLMRLEPIS